MVAACGGGGGGGGRSNNEGGTGSGGSGGSGGTTNSPPTANAGDDGAANPGDVVTLSGSGTDPEGSNLTYSWQLTGDAAGVTLSDADASNPTFTAPTVTQDTTLTFELTVTDAGGRTATDQVTITVNAPPTANAGDDTAANPGVVVTLNGSGTDPKGEAIAYSWTQTGGTPTVALNDAGISAPMFTAPTVTEDTTFTFELTVTAGGDRTATDQVTITVNAPPAAMAGDDQSVVGGAMATLAGSSRSSGGRGVTYTWMQTGGTPTVTLSNTGAQQPTFTVPTITAADIRAGTLTFTLLVTDSNGLTAQDTVTLRIDGAGLISMKEHAAGVRGVSISRDDSLAVSGGLDGTVRLWNANTGAAIRTLGSHDGAVYAVAINADGTHAISGGADGTVRLWTWDETSGGEVLYDDGAGATRSLGNQGLRIYTVALNKDASLAASGGFDGKVRVWNTARTGTNAGGEITYATSGEMHSLGNHGEHSVYGVSLSDDGSRALSGGADGTVRLWSVDNGTEVRSLADDDGPMGVVFGVSLSGDGTVAAAGAADNHVHVWNADTGAETHELAGHSADVSSVSLNEAGTRVLSTGGDGTVRLWNVDLTDPANGTEIRALRQHTDYGWSAALSGDGAVALSGGGDGKLNLWNTAAGPEDTTVPFATTERDRDPESDGQSVILGQFGVLGDVALSADGRRALAVGIAEGDSVGDLRTMYFWDTTTGELLRTMKIQHEDGDSLNSVSLSADGSRALVGSYATDGPAWFLDTSTGEVLRTMRVRHDKYFRLLGFSNAQAGVSLSANGRLALAGGGGVGILNLFDTTTGNPLSFMSLGLASADGLSLSADGRRALANNRGADVYLFDTTTGTLLHGWTFTGTHKAIYALSLSEDGSLSAAARGHFIYLWDSTTGDSLRTLSGHTDDVWSMSLSADGRLLLSSGAIDDTVRLWDTATGELLRTILINHKEYVGQATWIAKVSLSADGHLALLGGGDTAVRLLRLGRSDAAPTPSTANARVVTTE